MQPCTTSLVSWRLGSSYRECTVRWATSAASIITRLGGPALCRRAGQLLGGVRRGIGAAPVLNKQQATQPPNPGSCSNQ